MCQPCIAETNSTRSWCMILLKCWWIRQLLLKFFLHLCWSRILAYDLLFGCIFICFWNEDNADFIKWAWKFSIIFNFLNSLVQFTWVAICFRIFFIVRSSILITTLISLVVLCSDFLFLLDAVLEDCMFLEMYLFLPNYPICWLIVVCNISYNHLYFCGFSF